MKIADIARIIEAVVFVSGDGVDKDEFKRLYDLSDKELNKCLDILKEKYSGDSGIHIIQYKKKIQLCSNPELVENVAEILNPIRERSLTKAALETIAIIAYKQPITRTEIEEIRGVNCDYAVQLLQNNNLIEVVGRKDAVGKPLLFGTTETFLKRFELESLDALPNHKELLDRIRVIHSEGDSLYREFTIPEEGDGNAESVYIVEISTDTMQEIATAENIEQPINQDAIQEKSTSKRSSRKAIAEPVEQSADVEEKKVSWRDKMKAKMAENADNYENLDSVLEKKNKN